MGLLTGKTALVTGAARGIGKAVAMKFAKEGANIAFTDLVLNDDMAAGLDATRKEIEALGVTCRAYAGNAADFEETEKEPLVLPSRFPNLLVNGTSGIAVGMATNIPPHNLREIIDAVVKVIDNVVEEDRATTIEEVMEIVKGPDFPTGASILGTHGIEQAYRTGRGKIKVRAVTDIETMANGKSRIIVSELPFMVNKARLIEIFAELH